MNVTDILESQEFRTWHCKYEANYPCLSNSYLVMIHEVARALVSISIDYSNEAILSSGRSIPASTYKPVITLMN